MFRGSAAPPSVTLLFLKVCALGKKKKEGNSPVGTNELSLYSVPDFKSRFVEEPRSSLEEAISQLRTAMEPYASWFQAVYSHTKPTVHGAIQQGTASCDYLWNSPPEVFRRLSLISFSGVLGYFLARQSRLKRLVYPFALMGVTSSVYYPQHALGLALLFGEKLQGWGAVALARLRGSWETYVPEYPSPEVLEEEKHAFKQNKK